MPEHPRIGPWILLAALALGLAGDWLLWPGAYGVNVGLWLAAGAAAGYALVRGLRLASPRRRLALAAPAVLFGLLVALRDSPTLRLLDFLAIAVALSLPMWRAAAGGAWRATPGEAVQGLATCAGAVVAGAPNLVIGDVPWGALKGSGWGRHATAVARGLAIAGGPLLVFGGLFVSADAGFEATVAGLFDVDPVMVVAHAWVALGCAWLAAGLLREALAERAGVPAATAGGPSAGWTIGLVEVVIALGLVDALFAAFVAHQLPWFFGGQAFVAETRDLTLAEYARRGFFELSAVGALALPTLFWLRWLMGPTPDARLERVFRGLANGMLGLLLVIVASGAHRMAIYQAEYGLTELRVYVMAFEAWLAVLVCWFAGTVLRGRAQLFAAGAVAWGFAGVVALHVPNLEAAIVRTNVALATAHQPLDAEYLTRLSDDAVPALAAAMPTLPSDVRKTVADHLETVRQRDAEDWRTWNWARVRAQQAARAATEAQAAAAPAPRAALAR